MSTRIIEIIVKVPVAGTTIDHRFLTFVSIEARIKDIEQYAKSCMVSAGGDQFTWKELDSLP